VGKGVKKSHLHSCTVLEVGQDARRLWQFTVSGNQINLAAERTIPHPDPLPPKAGAKSLFQRRLNIAWLPADQVFLRAVRLPVVQRQELVSMLEFQLEKLSPFPVNQIVWSMELLPGPTDGQQTVIVIIAARDVVEAFLGKLEAVRYLPDRLELPQLHELLTTSMDADGAWLYPSREDNRILCLVAWWFGGLLQQVQMAYLPNTPQSASLLVEQLNKTAWAGEMEGWLTGPARWHLVAPPEFAAEWEPTLRQWSGEPIEVSAPPSKTALAELAARRAAQGESYANLLPSEYAVRYRQRFVDRLWLTGLGAVIGTYIAGVLIYFGVLAVMGWQKDGVVKQVKALSGSYTNAIKLKEKIDVLQSQLDLKYAALDAFKAISENLPDGLFLTSLTFSKGKTVSLIGSAPVDQSEVLTKFAKDLREASVEDQKVFSNVPLPKWTLVPGMGGQQIRWDVTCELKRTDTE
jgi:hypothetical protein